MEEQMTPRIQFEAKAREVVVNLYLGEDYTQQYANWRNQLVNPVLANAIGALMSAYDASVGEVIGEDEDTTKINGLSSNHGVGAGGNSHRRAKARNALRAEQRQRAGLEGK